MSSKQKMTSMVLAAMLLAVALVLPFLTGQIQQIGNALCPMHIPVLICGFLCGPWYGLAVGFIAPLLRFAVFGMPPILPMGVSMSFELATYGLVTGLLHSRFPRTLKYIYGELIIAMIAGRVVWGIVRVLLYGIGQYEFSWKLFIAGALLNAIPGIIIQLVIIPLLVLTLERIRKIQ